jgi:membrane-associated phospholipid phosphatase
MLHRTFRCKYLIISLTSKITAQKALVFTKAFFLFKISSFANKLPIKMPLKRTSTTILLIVLIIGFLILSFFATNPTVPPIDIAVSHLLQRTNNNWLDQIMLAISIFGEIPYSLISVLLVAFIFFRYKFKLEAVFISLTLFSGLLILLIKNLVNRARPTEFYVRLVEVNRFQSFPSGHVLSYVLFFGFLILLMRELKEIPLSIRKGLTYNSYFLIFAIPLSRIYLGAHWFTDVLGGMLLGLICLIILSHLYLKKKRGQSNPPRPRHLN